MGQDIRGRRSGPWPALTFRSAHRSPTCGTSGDGVKEYANGGTTACAETAKFVADQIAARFALAAQPEEGR